MVVPLAERIVDAAERRLAEGGVAGLTLRALARDVGVTAPAIYTHFRGTDDIVGAVLARRFGRLDTALEQAAADAASAHDRLEMLCAAYCRFALEEPALYAALFGPGAPTSGVAYAGSPGERTFERFVDAVRAASDADDDATPRARAATLWAALHGLVTLRAGLPDFPWPELDGQIRVLREGVAPST